MDKQAVFGGLCLVVWFVWAIGFVCLVLLDTPFWIPCFLFVVNDGYAQS